MNKPQRTYLKTLAAQIEDTYIKKFGKPMIYTAVEKRQVPHDYVILGSGLDMKGGFEVTGERMKFEVNHFRRLKRGFVKSGVDGVFNYLKECGFKPKKEVLETLLQ